MDSKDVLKKGKEYTKNSIKIFFNYFKSQIISSIIMGIVISIALVILKIKFPIIIGLSNGILNLIPYLGNILGMFIGGIIAFIFNGTKEMIWTLILIFVVQQIVGTFISPKIMGKALDLSPFLVFIIITIGGSTFGIPGLVLSVPIAAIIKMLYLNIKKDKIKEEIVKEKRQ